MLNSWSEGVSRFRAPRREVIPTHPNTNLLTIYTLSHKVCKCRLVRVYFQKDDNKSRSKLTPQHDARQSNHIIQTTVFAPRQDGSETCYSGKTGVNHWRALGLLFKGLNSQKKSVTIRTHMLTSVGLHSQTFSRLSRFQTFHKPLKNPTVRHQHSKKTHEKSKYPESQKEKKHIVQFGWNNWME